MENINKKITRFGYIIKKDTINEKELKEIKEDLTVKPNIVGNYGKRKENKFKIYKEDKIHISIPKYYGIEKLGEPDINKIELYDYPKVDIEYKGELRPHQKEIVNKVIEGFEKYRGGLLIAGCGSGKTNMAIYIACKYKLKTLMIVHKTFLKNQAINRILSTTNIKKVGIIQQKKVETEYDFVVGMIQSLCKIEYDDNLFKDFGMIIIDEVHHMGAKNFSKLYQKMTCKYMLGISAERKRNDGMYKIINWYMGPILHVEEQKPNDMVIVKRFNFRTSNVKRMETIINKYTKEPDRSTMITNLVHIKSRNRLIINLIKELYDQGKNILCLTGRIKQTTIIYKLLEKDEYMKGNIGKYIGKMSEKELDISATKQIIIGTYSMAEEGLDIENLNVVILCTPKSSIKQSVGRILRKDIYEEHPIVIDIIDNDNFIFKNQSKRRKEYFDKQNYYNQNFYISDYELKDYYDYNDKEYIKKSLILVKENNTLENDIEFLDD